MVVLLAGLSLASLLQLASKRADSFVALLQRAFEFHRQQQYRRSIPLLEQARVLRPRDYLVNFLLGIDTLRLGSPAESLGFFHVALEVRPRDADALGYLAEAHAALQQFDQAAQALRVAATQSGASSQARLALIQFYLRRFRAVAEELRSTRAGPGWEAIRRVQRGKRTVGFKSALEWLELRVRRSG
ncbi:MAG: tetratricopeptide repeat protein [Acidobacteria bacterium]|nr:tetratricopeptide repeat protein [Acidobacteriota bacterium]MCI0720324.1 tetratricopeptide repeat protein [Acidobacteriota bacterium]